MRNIYDALRELTDATENERISWISDRQHKPTRFVSKNLRNGNVILDLVSSALIFKDGAKMFIFEVGGDEAARGRFLDLANMIKVSTSENLEVVTNILDELQPTF